MKLELWKEYEFDRDGYTNSKTDFIQKYTEKKQNSNMEIDTNEARSCG